LIPASHDAKTWHSTSATTSLSAYRRVEQPLVGSRRIRSSRNLRVFEAPVSEAPSCHSLIAGLARADLSANGRGSWRRITQTISCHHLCYSRVTVAGQLVDEGDESPSSSCRPGERRFFSKPSCLIFCASSSRRSRFLRWANRRTGPRRRSCGRRFGPFWSRRRSRLCWLWRRPARRWCRPQRRSLRGTPLH
jgi:hypothetical protein